MWFVIRNPLSEQKKKYFEYYQKILGKPMFI